jgi:hypothetical protein
MRQFLVTLFALCLFLFCEHVVSFSANFASHLHHNGLYPQKVDSPLSWPMTPDFKSFLKEFTGENLFKYVVNIGAHNGVGFDPVVPLLSAGYNGLMVEGDKQWFEILPQNMATYPGKLSILLEFVYPATVTQKFRENS